MTETTPATTPITGKKLATHRAAALFEGVHFGASITATFLGVAVDSGAIMVEGGLDPERWALGRFQDSQGTVFNRAVELCDTDRMRAGGRYDFGLGHTESIAPAGGFTLVRTARLFPQGRHVQYLPAAACP